MADVALATAKEAEPRWLLIWRNAFPFLVVGAVWEIVARLGVFPPRLFPSLETITAAFWRLTLAGILPHHALDTVIRLGLGFALAAVAGGAGGGAVGRPRPAAGNARPPGRVGAPPPGPPPAPPFFFLFCLRPTSAAGA